MIGVIADPADQEVVREFFELFKTPWELYRPGESYDVLLSASDSGYDSSAKLTVVYSGRRTGVDHKHKFKVRGQRRQPCTLIHQGMCLPLYGETVTFDGAETYL